MFALMLINAETNEWFSTVRIHGVYGFTGDAIRRIRKAITQEENYWSNPIKWKLLFDYEDVTDNFLELEKM